MANERDSGFDSTGMGGLNQERDFETGTFETGRMGSSTGGSDMGTGQPMTARAKDAVSTAGHRAVERVQERFADQVSRATGQLGSVASSLRTAGEQMPDDGIGRYMVQAATQVDNLASFLNNREVGELVDEVEEFARRQPAVFIGGAFALGVLGARFLRSSRQKMGMDYDRGSRTGFFEGGYEDGRRTPASSATYSGGPAGTAGGYPSGYDAASDRLGATGSTIGDHSADSIETGRGYSGAGGGTASTGRDLASDLPTGLRTPGASVGGMSGSGTAGSTNLSSSGSTLGRDRQTVRPSQGNETRSATTGQDSLSARPGSGSDRIGSGFDERSPDFL